MKLSTDDIVNTQTKNGMIALCVACINGHYDIASILLQANADPNIQTENGWTPLTIASRKNYTNIVQLLIEHGADINYRLTVTGATALILASEHGHADIVRILLEKGAGTRIESANGDTAIDVAAKGNLRKLLYSYQYKLARSVSQLSISSFTGSFSDDASLLSKATLACI